MYLFIKRKEGDRERFVPDSFMKVISFPISSILFFFHALILMKFVTVAAIASLFVHQVLAKPAEGCLQTHIITTNDTCVSVAAQYKISEADFYAMNPGLHHSVQHNCDNLDTGKPFCVCLTAPCAVAADVVSNNVTTPTNSSTAASASIAVSGASTSLPSASAASSSVVSSILSSSASASVSSTSISNAPSLSASPASASKTPSSAVSLTSSSALVAAGIACIAVSAFI
ncbi:hypothetical protein BCV72DRAFT_244353 [Rhizopus microsporus var. microsporus]|uniref:LysM domain-containing protein n=2 Tax=Rhizopus microsporus TaxID=58291 RepID=A0A2G4SRW0_RHIZD|nr:uncharacterized protein RHIMIDRAFT_298126 [Rhizopus microsporus ATCC 52813]ORE03472.1 hypothetical protein BCV72DRAFT_244353 [Rhizopus microsporus var. microsporus]PHZ11485.1 hypothetical protein RHIMIDRAFT_298126 [Rhizopus microsporus ATCC 52813]